jgi:hypothetical protein
VNLTKKNRQRRVVTPPTPFEQARDELFQQIMRCEVIGASPEHQVEWFNETVAYFGERYPELKPADVSELRKLGERFVQPPKATIVIEDAPAIEAAAPETDDADADAAIVDELLASDGSSELADTADAEELVDVEEAETVPA